MKSGHGSFSRKRTRWGSTISTRGHPLLEELGRGAPVALEGELHVLGGEGVAVVEHDALAEHELVAEAVLGDMDHDSASDGAMALPGIGFTMRVVHRVQHLHDRDDPGVLARDRTTAGASDTCTAHVIWLWARRGRARGSRSRVGATARAQKRSAEPS